MSNRCSGPPESRDAPIKASQTSAIVFSARACLLSVVAFLLWSLPCSNFRPSGYHVCLAATVSLLVQPSHTAEGPLPRKSSTTNILIDLLFYGSIEEVLVANKTHPVYVIVKLIIVWALCEESNRGSHLQETVSEEFQSLIVSSHSSLDMYLLGSMLLGIIGVFCECFKG